MKNKETEIQNIAEKIREEFEQNRLSKDLLAQMYADYNQEVDAETFVAESQKYFPSLNCGLASVYLHSILGGEVIQGKYEENNHTFLLVDGDKVVDITADQYGGPRVFVGELRLPWAKK